MTDTPNIVGKALLVDDSDDAPEVADAREILQGGSIALVGGERRTDAAETIRRRLGLREVAWAETSERRVELLRLRHTDDLRCVVVLIRFIRHYTHDAAREWCRQRGIPMVTLTGGYSVNRVARGIVERMR